MHLSNESLVVIILVGLVAGWLAGLVMQGSGFGLIGDVIVGLLGALIGDWLLPRLNIHLGSGIVSLIASAMIGAIVLLFVLRLIGGRGWGYRRWRWRRRW
ncbi:MAG: GlsB/YeaQ/YmgE family stress response membrane protein [Alphaproteobacteria bacterium]|nr:GlsB/YeaQ/YmgE family stress response membrane protein [Alphaproteobacteria bacterium]